MQNDLFQTLVELVRFKSTYDRPAELHACADYIASFFEGTDLVVDRIVYNGVPSVVVTKGTKTPRVFLSGHFDVVPADEDQFEPVVEGDQVFGRGVFDMKSGVVVMMHVMRELAKTPHDVGLMLTGDEEIGGYNGTKILMEQGYRAEVVVVPDGGEAVHQLIAKEKGILRVTLRASGKSAHASRIWKGDNAIERLCDAVMAVRGVFVSLEEHPEDHWVTTASVGIIQAGKAINQIPGVAEASYDIRFTEHETPDAILARIQAVLPEHVELLVTLNESNTFVAMDHPLVVPYAKAIEHHGRPFVVSLGHGASDGRHFAEQGIPFVMSQPDGGNHHGPGEWVSLSAVQLYADVLKTYLDEVAL